MNNPKNPLTLSVRRTRKPSIRTNVNTGADASKVTANRDGGSVVPDTTACHSSIKDTGGVSIRNSLNASVV